MGINYSSAKYIIRLYKTEHLKTRDPMILNPKLPIELPTFAPNPFRTMCSYRDICLKVKHEESNSSCDQADQTFEADYMSDLRPKIIRSPELIASNNLVLIASSDIFQ